jgi:hypothetical protein
MYNGDLQKYSLKWSFANQQHYCSVRKRLLPIFILNQISRVQNRVTHFSTEYFSAVLRDGIYTSGSWTKYLHNLLSLSSVLLVPNISAALIPLRSWLKHYDTSRTVMVSSLDGVLTQSFRPHNSLGSTPPLTEINTRNLPSG